jgi:hypothetical protein
MWKVHPFQGEMSDYYISNINGMTCGSSGAVQRSPPAFVTALEKLDSAILCWICDRAWYTDYGQCIEA